MIFNPALAVVIVMLRACVAVCAGDSESVTFTVKDEVPVEVAVPEITPAVEIEKPAGKAPLAKLNFYGATPPVAARVWL